MEATKHTNQRRIHAMNTIAQNVSDVQVAGTISRFMKRYGICRLLKACGAYKEKGISVVRLFVYNGPHVKTSNEDLMVNYRS